MTYYYPNRPMLVPPDPKNPFNPDRGYLDSLELTGKYVGELKWNGDNALIYIFKDDIQIWNRHKALLKTYKPSPEVLEELKMFPSNSIINAEIVHSKTKTVKDKIIVHCVMQWDGESLNGMTWGDSRRILESLIGGYGSHVILSETFTREFWNIFHDTDGKIVEGIILKNPTGLLKFSQTPIPDVPWMLKIRKPSKKYSF